MCCRCVGLWTSLAIALAVLAKGASRSNLGCLVEDRQVLLSSLIAAKRWSVNMRTTIARIELCLFMPSLTDSNLELGKTLRLNVRIHEEVLSRIRLISKVYLTESATARSVISGREALLSLRTCRAVGARGSTRYEFFFACRY
jgi:hypothetical protein